MAIRMKRAGKDWIVECPRCGKQRRLHMQPKYQTCRKCRGETRYVSKSKPGWPW